jgi:thiol:disulfide interchange protein DsbD
MSIITGLVTVVLVAMVAFEGGSQDGLIHFDDEEDLVAEPLIDLSAAFSVSSALAGRTYQAAAIVTVDSGWHINSAKPYQEWLIPAVLQVDTIPEAVPLDIEYPAGDDAPLLDETISVYGGRVVIPFGVRISGDAPQGEYQLPVRLTYQPCDSRTCLAPDTVETTLTVTVGDEGRPVNKEIFGIREDTAVGDTTGAVPPGQESGLEDMIRRYGFWGYLLALGLAFVTGLLLSFSPCTYPMIPITVSIFAGQERGVGRGFLLSLVYVGTMAVIYGLMGLIVSLVGGVFGAWLASPPVVIGIAVVFVVFAMSMFGLYEIQVPSFLRQRLGKTRTGGGVVGSVVLGTVAALVVSPCVGPFVAGILLYIATTGSPVVGFLVLFVFALGLGTLYVIIGTFSTAISKLPRSGEWMESVKKFFGFVLLLMALYFLRTLISPELLAVLTGLLLLVFGVFAGGLDRLTPESGYFARLRKLLGILGLLVSFYLLVGSLLRSGLILPSASEWLPGGGVSMESSSGDVIPWETNLEDGLTRALREGKPVLIDTWATWCVNCRILERRTFRDPAVVAEARRFVPIRMQLETAGGEETKDFLSRFGLRQYTLPTTLLLDSEGNIRRILKGVVPPEIMIDEMNKIH